MGAPRVPSMIYCFFRCGHAIALTLGPARGDELSACWEQMEAHYNKAHQDQLDSILNQISNGGRDQITNVIRSD